jgi:hypothetical protein
MSKNNTPESAKLGFFCGCPKCGKKFMVAPKFISAYITRLVKRYQDQYTGVGQMLEAAQAELNARTTKKEG